MINQQQPMSEADFAQWEARVQQAAREFAYPPTPDIAGRVRQRVQPPQTPYRPRLTWALLIALVCVVGLTVPEVRAAVLQVLRIGGITIFEPEPTATSTSTQAAATSTSQPRPRATTRGLLISALDLPGETTLEAAREQVTFPVPLPGYPAELGDPERVFVNELDGQVVTLVWLADGSETQPYIVLQILDLGVTGVKFHPTDDVITTEVNGEHAVWLFEPHMLELFENGTDTQTIRRQVSQPVLIWEMGRLTYRLESDLSMVEAIRVAESLE